MNRLSPKGSEFKIQVLVFPRAIKGKEVWVAQGLEYDIVAQAPTLERLENRFMRTVLGYFVYAFETKTPVLNGIKPAPKRFWETYQSGRALEQPFSLAPPSELVPKRFPTNELPRGAAPVHVAEAQQCE